MRREDNFNQLARNNKIVIPIIQRDYAQGRDNAKALMVRTRLIDEWIDILKNDDLRMDFNYIYGSESKGDFYPVDGQQRLTSLYLLHWYLAFATDHASEIACWNFDYKTRNSASEFFAFLRNTEQSEILFGLLCSDNSSKLEEIQNEKWFKSKWEHDPTIIFCLNFLCMMSEKMLPYRERFPSFWDRLHCMRKPAVYFTRLSENDDEYGEIDAAKKYTRMNARGKRLADFENLKAMIDEIEMKYITGLGYCDEGHVTDTVSWSYDRVYIDKFYQSAAGSSLNEKAKGINDESDRWYRLIYYVYCLKYRRKVPGNIMKDMEEGAVGDTYEDVIYKLSQERMQDDTITQYLYMLKAVQEILCNSKEGLAYRYQDFSIDNRLRRWRAVSFVIFVSDMWKRTNTASDNTDLLEEWNRFEKLLEDLNYEEWELGGEAGGEALLAQIIDDLAAGIAGSPSGGVHGYFIGHDFEQDNPFGTGRVLKDIKCRILERKIKSKLMMDGVISDDSIDQACVGKRRLGYLYEVCGYLDDWGVGDWSGKPKWSGNSIHRFAELIINNGSAKEFLSSDTARKVYAFASQYDLVNRKLHSEAEINKCNNEHIWKNDYCEWSDDEYGQLEITRKKQLSHLKTMLHLLDGYRNQNGIDSKTAMEEYAGEINHFFANDNGHGKCWLRIVCKLSKGGNEFLTRELIQENGVVQCDGIPVILKAYLSEAGYRYKEKVDALKCFDKNFIYSRDRGEQIPYAGISCTCTFPPDTDNDGKYRHTTKQGYGWDLSGNEVKRNMDLNYTAYLNLSKAGYSLESTFLSFDICKEGYQITAYKLGDSSSGQVAIYKDQAVIGPNVIQQAEGNISRWNTLFKMIVGEPSKKHSYDRWIELWNNEYVTAFGQQFQIGDAVYEKRGGQRPKKVWKEAVEAPALAWKRVQDAI